MKRLKLSTISYILIIVCLAIVISFGIIVVSIVILKPHNSINGFYIDMNMKEETITFFNENKEIIERSISKNDFKPVKEAGALYIEKNDNYILFKCFAEGILPDCIDYGFIYSKDNNIDNFVQGSVKDYKKKNRGKGCIYIDIDGDNHCYIDKIEDNYYYYQQNW